VARAETDREAAMMAKTYVVQTWDSRGALTNSYEVVLATPKEVSELKTFLKKGTAVAHSVITLKGGK
jgi:hypothetical protein